MKYYSFHEKTAAQRSDIFQQIDLDGVWAFYIFTPSPSGTGGAVYLGANGILQVGQDERIGGRSNHGLLQQCFCKGNHKVRPCGHNFSGCSPPILPSYCTGDLLSWECPTWLLWGRISSCWLPTGSHSIAPSRLAKWLASGSPPSWLHSQEAGAGGGQLGGGRSRAREGERRCWGKERGRADLNEMEKLQEDLRETEPKRKRGGRGW